MLHVLNLIYNWSFLGGAVLGLAGMRMWCRARARYLDAMDPLPNGDHRTAGGLNMTWMAAAITAGVMGYVLLQAEGAHQDTLNLTAATNRCWSERYTRTRGFIEDQVHLSDLGRRQWQIQRDTNAAYSELFKAVIDPPPELAGDSLNDPRRQAWTLGITRLYEFKIQELDHQSDALFVERDRVDADRKAHPLPEITCGR
jgi:hypothetical protein